MFSRNKKNRQARAARRYFQDGVDYWEGRIALGDPLFDQHMVDSYEAAKQGIDALNKLEVIGIDTGMNDILPRERKSPYTSVVISFPQDLWGRVMHYDMKYMNKKRLVKSYMGPSASLLEEMDVEATIEKLKSRLAEEIPGIPVEVIMPTKKSAVLPAR